MKKMSGLAKRLMLVMFALLLSFGAAGIGSLVTKAAVGDYYYDGVVGSSGVLGYDRVAAGDDGLVYLAGYAGGSLANNMIIAIDSTGAIVHQFGKYGNGGGGKLMSVYSLAVTHDYVYVMSDINDGTYGYVVQKFTHEGTFLGETLRNLGNNQPMSMVVDEASNSIYTLFLSSGSFNVAKFALDGGSDAAPVWQTGLADVHYVSSMGLRDEKLFLFDQSDRKVRVLWATDGSDLNQTITLQDGDYAERMAIDPTDGSLVFSGGYNLYRYLTDGTRLAAGQVGEDKSITSLTFNSSGQLYAMDGGSGLKVILLSDDLAESGTIIPDTTGRYGSPRLIARDSNDNLYVFDESYQITGLDYQHRAVQIFSPDGQPIGKRVLRTNYSSENGDSYYNITPYWGMIILPDGRLCVGGSISVQEAESSQQYGLACYTEGEDKPQFMVPSALGDYSFYVQSVVYDQARNQLVFGGSIHNNSDSQSYVFARFSLEGSFIDVFQRSNESSGTGIYIDMSVSGVAYMENDNYYIVGYYNYYDENDPSNSINAALYKYNASTGKITPIQLHNSSDGVIQTNASFHSVAVDKQGNVYGGGYYSLYNSSTGIEEQTCSVMKYSSSGEKITCVAQQGYDDESMLGWLYYGALVVSTDGRTVQATGSWGGSPVKRYRIESDVPGAPLDLRSNGDSTTTTLDVAWNEPSFDGFASIDGYRIAYRVAGTSNWQYVDVSGNNVFDYQLTGLNEGTDYEIQIFAHNRSGLSAASNLLMLRTLGDDTSPIPVTPVVPGVPNTGV